MIQDMIQEYYDVTKAPKRYHTSSFHQDWYKEKRRNINVCLGDRNFGVSDDEILREGFPLCEVKSRKKCTTNSNTETTTIPFKSGKKKKPKIRNDISKKERLKKLKKFCKINYGIGKCDHYLERGFNFRGKLLERKTKFNPDVLVVEESCKKKKKKKIYDRFSLFERGADEYIRSSKVRTRFSPSGFEDRKDKLRKRKMKSRFMLENGIYDLAYGLWNSELSNEALNRRRLNLLNKVDEGFDSLYGSSNKKTYDSYLRTIEKNPYVNFIQGRT